METFLNEFYGLFTLHGLTALGIIIFIDIVMSGDNAILIGMATKDLKGKDRKKAILLGIGLATILRIIFASMTVFLMGIVGLKFAGGLLLMYVVWKFYKELRSGDGHHEGVEKVPTTLLSAISLIVIADISMSLDNVLAVAGAANENMVALGIGLIFSIILMAVASNFIAGKLEKYPQIQWLGLLVIMFVAMGMMLEGSHEITQTTPFHYEIMPFMIFILGSLGIFLHKKYLKPMNETKIKTWISENYLKIIISNLLMITILILFGDIVKFYLMGHSSILYTVLLIVIFAIIELSYLIKLKK